MRSISYGIAQDGAALVSRVGSEIAWPILDYEGMTPANNFAMHYNLERFSVFSLAGPDYANIRWTRKIPIDLKNKHRAFWGMKPLPTA